MDGANDVSRGSDAPLVEPFTIHSFNNYTNVGLTSVVEALELGPRAVRALILGGYLSVESQLSAAGIKYASLNGALVPKNRRYEVAYIFDSTRIDSDLYGLEIANHWIPAVERFGPTTSALSVGDIVNLPSEIVWQQLDKYLVRQGSFPRVPSLHYFVAHVTNLSKGQREKLHAALQDSTDAYIGYVDTTTWKPIMIGMLLPQVGLRSGDKVITAQVDGEAPNLAGYPYEANGLTPVGVDDFNYGTYLDHRLDNGIPQWAAQDSRFALTALGGDQQPVSTSALSIDDSRLEYLQTKHASSLSAAGLDGLDREGLVVEIRNKIAHGLVYNLRFVQGTRSGMPAPENDAMMYSVQVAFPSSDGSLRRFQVGLKYRADTHTSEIATFY